MSEDVPAPPPFPWKRGRHGTHDVVLVEVTVCRDEFGRVYSSHKLAADEDRQIALSWPTGGQEQVGFALLTEAVRREAILTLLVLMSQNPELVASLQALPEEALRARIDAMGQSMSANVRRTVEAIAAGSLHDALGFIAKPG